MHHQVEEDPQEGLASVAVQIEDLAVGAVSKYPLRLAANLVQVDAMHSSCLKPKNIQMMVVMTNGALLSLLP